MLATASILSFIKILQLPFGGTVTLCSMVPIIFIALNYPIRWALVSSVAYGLLQMLFSFYPPPTGSFMGYIGVILLDYIIAFGLLGLAGLCSRLFKGTKSIFLSSAVVIFGRFLCHFTSGIVVWSVYAPERQSAVIYSLIYNGTYMGFELVFSLIALIIIRHVLPRGYGDKSSNKFS